MAVTTSSSSTPKKRKKFGDLPVSFRVVLNLLCFLLLPLMMGPLPLAFTLEDDLFYFTSFANVKEWPQVYNTCKIDFNYQYGLEEIHYLHLQDSSGVLAAPAEKNPLDKGIILVLSLDTENLPNTLSPIEIKHAETMCLRANSKQASCKSALKKDEYKILDEEEVLKVFNNPPPPLGSYGVSYGFQKNKECAITTDYSPCYVNPQFGRIRGVVLTANRRQLRDVREQFTVEDPNQFVSILDGGSTNERQFYEAIFMGSSEPVDCKSERSSHILDGKCYPMEIYMYFVDETVPTMAMTTIIVVPVEFSDEENQKLRPVVNAVTELYEQERIFLPKNDDLTRDERMFHHKGPSTVFRYPHHPEDTDYFYIPSSIDVENLITAQMDHIERVLTYKAKFGLLHEKFLESRALELKLIGEANATGARRGALFDGEAKISQGTATTTTPEPGGSVDEDEELAIEKTTIEKLLDVEKASTNIYQGITLAKLRVLRYMMSESYNQEVKIELEHDKGRPDDIKQKTIPLLEGHWPGAVTNKELDRSNPDVKAFTDALEQFLGDRDAADISLNSNKSHLTYNERIQALKDIRQKWGELEKNRVAMFEKLPAFIYAVCDHFTPGCKEWTLADIKDRRKGKWHTDNKEGAEEDWRGLYPRFLEQRMEFGQDLAINRLERENNGWKELLKKKYFETGFKVNDNENFQQRDAHYLGKEYQASTPYTFGNVFVRDKYVSRQLRTFLTKKDSDHIFRYHDYKKKEARKGKLKNPDREILLGNLAMKESEFDKLEALQPPSFFLKNDFQVSWLFPKGGGYYRYKGSSPVPPCYGAENVIVFRKPIKASRQQIKVLTTIPTSHLKARDIWNTFGVRTTKRPTNNNESRNIYFDPRNHQFMVGDGFHGNSVLEYQKRQSKKNGAGSNKACLVTVGIVSLAAAASLLI